MVFHWSLSDSKSSPFSRTLLNILADLSNAAVWMVSTRLLISKSYSPFINPSVSVPRAPITIGITVTFMFLSYPSFCFPFYSGWSAGTSKSTIRQVLFFLFIITRSGRLTEIRGSVFISKSMRSLCVSLSRTDSEFRNYYFFRMVKSKLLEQYPDGSPCPSSRI